MRQGCVNAVAQRPEERGLAHAKATLCSVSISRSWRKPASGSSAASASGSAAARAADVPGSASAPDGHAIRSPRRAFRRGRQAVGGKSAGKGPHAMHQSQRNAGIGHGGGIGFIQRPVQPLEAATRHADSSDQGCLFAQPCDSVCRRKRLRRSPGARPQASPATVAAASSRAYVDWPRIAGAIDSNKLEALDQRAV